MLTFTQTDNAGKNAMFDVWFDPSEWQGGTWPGDIGESTGSYGILYPRPYDMDTQMGLDNKGEDTRLSSSELNIALSPVSCTGRDLKEPSHYIPNWDAMNSPDQ
jgi:hypothetical protein